MKPVLNHNHELLTYICCFYIFKQKAKKLLFLCPFTYYIFRKFHGKRFCKKKNCEDINIILSCFYKINCSKTKVHLKKDLQGNSTWYISSKKTCSINKKYRSSSLYTYFFCS